MQSGNTNACKSEWLDPTKHQSTSGDPLAIEAIDYIEIISGNAKQSMYFYSQGFGFKPVAYRGPETGCRESASYVLKQNDLTLVISSPLFMNASIASKVLVHGDTVCDTAMQVPDCEAFYHEAMKRGAKSVKVPTKSEDEFGSVKIAAIATYGEVIHSIIERKEYSGLFLPGFVPYTKVFPEFPQSSEVGLLSFDHIVGNVELGKMEEWVSFYEQVLGFSQFQHFSEEDVSTEYSALMSKVMANGTTKIKFPINEPAEGKRKSQIQEYLEYHNGPGVQHIALACKDIIKTVGELRRRGLNFLYVPETYYEEVPKRVGEINEDLQALQELGILVDRDDDGYLLQLFTKPVQDRPTLFFEIIQREGSKGFGIGNFKALFESIERDQALRGNL